MVDAPVKMHTLECPLYMATHEEDFCTVGVLEGSNMELNYYENNVLKSTFTIAGILVNIRLFSSYIFIETFK